MTIQQLPVYTGEIPALGQEQSEFNTNVSNKLAYDAQLIPAQNIYATEANALAAGVESSAADAASSAAAAASNSNFKGNWSDATGASNIPASYRHNGKNWQQLQNIADITTQEPSENSFWTELSNVTESFVQNTASRKNELSNSNFLTQSPDAITHPNPTPESYTAGTQIFSGVYAGGSGCTITLINGRVNCTVGSYQFKVPNTGGLERVPVFTSSVSDYDGTPKEIGVSHALVGNEYVVTVAPAAGSVFGVKFEQGSVATGHEVRSLSAASLSEYTDIVYKASGGNSAVDNMIAGIPVAANVGDSCSTGGTRWKRVGNSDVIDDFQSLSSVSSIDYTLTNSSFNSDLQSHIDQTNINGSPYVYIPTYNKNYEINSPLTFELGDIRIYGDKAQQYNHPFQDGTAREFRTGNLVASTGNTECIIDLGNSKDGTARNLAMAYTVDHLSFVGNGTSGCDAIQYTGKQNGPDRPMNLSNLSVYNCNHGLRFLDPGVGVSIQYATLNLHHSTFGFNNIAVLAEGPIFGAHINDCNLEANSNGCIHGNFNKAVTLNNNMMENTKNPVNLNTSSGVKLRSWGNYFEFHPTSDYLYRVFCPSAFLENTVDVSGDIYSGGIPDFPILIEGAGRFTVKADTGVKLKPNIAGQPMIINIDSNILNSTEGYKVDDLKDTLLIGVDGGLNRTDISSEWIHSYPTLSPFLSSNPLGLTNVSDMADGIQIDAGESIMGKLVVHNFLIKAKSAFPEAFPPVVLQARTPGGAFVSGPGNIVDYMETDISHGSWALCTIAWVPINNVQTFEFFIEEAARNFFYVAGVTTRVYGPYAKDGTDPTFTINPAMPNIT